MRTAIGVVIAVAAVVAMGVLARARSEPEELAAKSPTDVRTAASVDRAPQRFRVGGRVKAPIKLVDATPVYPEDAKAAGIHGVVILNVVIGEDGTVIDAEVIRSIPELDQAAIDAVTQWEYEPTILDDEPIEIEMAVTINFTLE